MKNKMMILSVSLMVVMALAAVAEAGLLRRIGSRARHPFRGGCANGVCR